MMDVPVSVDHEDPDGRARVHVIYVAVFEPTSQKCNLSQPRPQRE